VKQTRAVTDTDIWPHIDPDSEPLVRWSRGGIAIQLIYLAVNFVPCRLRYSNYLECGQSSGHSRRGQHDPPLRRASSHRLARNVYKTIRAARRSAGFLTVE
jgi:hypothetical protein